MRQVPMNDVIFRVYEVSDWVRDLIKAGNADLAAHWARELVGICRRNELLDENKVA